MAVLGMGATSAPTEMFNQCVAEIGSKDDVASSWSNSKRMFPQKEKFVGNHLKDCTASEPRRPHSTYLCVYYLFIVYLNEVSVQFYTKYISV
jgi:hypothetical protein